MNIRLANKEDAEWVAKLHRQEIEKAFLGSLGNKFLSKLYEAMVSSQNAFLIVAEDNGKIVGFASGCASVNRFYKEFFKKYFLKIAFILLLKIFNFSVLKKIFETLRYMGQKKEDIPEAEFLSMAVLKDYRRLGVATDFFKVLVEEMKKRGVKKFKAIVGEKLEPISRYHEKMGAKIHSYLYVHKNMPSKIYVYNLDDLNGELK